MAKFCRHCGQPLEEGQVCTCQSAQAAPEAPVATAEAPAAAPAAGNGFGKKLLDTLKNYWKTPKEAAAAVAEDKQGMAVAGVFAGVNALAVFFFLWRIIGMLLSMVTESASGMDVDMDEVMEYLEIEQPIFPMLIAGIGIAVLGILLTALVVFIAGKINKTTVDLKKQIVIASVHSAFPTALLLVGIILGLLAWWLQVLVVTVILVLWFVNICNEIRETAGVQIMETGKTLVIHSLVIFALYMVVVYLIVAIGGWGIGELSIQGHTINEAMENAGDIFSMLEEFM